MLSRSQKDRAKEEIQSDVDEAKLQLQSDLLATKKSLVKAQKKRAEMLGKAGIDFKQLCDVDNEIEAFERGIERLEKYAEDLF